jgi:hypothetical protein
MQVLHENKKTPNNRLREQRELRGWSPREVALKLQALFPGMAVTAKDVRRWERGDRKPGPYYRPKLCVLFGTTEEQLGFPAPSVSSAQSAEVCEMEEQEERYNSGMQAPSPPADPDAGTPAEPMGESVVLSIVIPASHIQDIAQSLQNKPRASMTQWVPGTFPYWLSTTTTRDRSFSPSGSNMEGIISRAGGLRKGERDGDSCRTPLGALLRQTVQASSASQTNTTGDDEEDMDAKKRNSMQKISTVIGGAIALNHPLGYQLFTLAQRGPRLHDEEVLDICKIEIPIWWRLFFEGHHTEIRKVLPDYLLRLTPLAERPSRHQKMAANLASQAHQLAYLLTIQKQDFCTAQMHTKQAFQYGVIAQDFNLQTTALIREGHVYYLVNDPESMLYTLQKAFQHCKKIPSLIQGRTYTGLAKAHGFLKQEQEADRFLGLTHDTFPEHPEEDPTYAYTHWDWFTPAHYEVVTYLQLNQPKNAWQVCERIANTGNLRTTHRVELLVRQAETAFALGRMDQCCSYVQQAVIAALELGSDLRYQQAYDVYHLMVEKWPREKDVKELAELFPRQERP